MSDKEKNKEILQETQEPEKFVTKYDRKMQRRQEQREREEKEKQLGAAISIVVLVALVVLLASFPVRRFIATHETFVTVGGQSVTKAEFDYNFNVTVSNYVAQYGSYLSYFGLDLTQDLSEQMYSETMSWQDYFEEMTVEALTNSKALTKAADAAGFTYDSTAEIKAFKAAAKKNAATNNLSVKNYLKSLYGSYATMNNVTSYMEKSIRGTAFYQKVSQDKAPTDAEIQARYDENPGDYDSVDYYQTLVNAELPTEPTELADPVDEEADEDEDAAYQPSDAEIAKAMDDAKEIADATDPKSGELMENAKQASLSYLISDWLFDDERKEGDSTVIADDTNHRYYVLSFAKRYLDMTATADVRIIVPQDVDGQAVLDEWKTGAATENSFIELYKKYSAGTSSSVTGGLMEGVTKDNLESSMADWIFAEGRAAGDATAITTESGSSYVIYYVGAGKPAWQNEIKSTLLNDTMTDYMDEISADILLEDKKGKLNYLKIQEEEDAADEAEDEEDGEVLDLSELGLQELDPSEVEELGLGEE